MSQNKKTKDEFDMLQEELKLHEDKEKIIKEMESNREVTKRLQDQLSIALYDRYEGLMDAGFSEEQAFQICLYKGLIV